MVSADEVGAVDEGLEFVLAGRTTIRRGMRECPGSKGREHRPGSYVCVLVCEAGGGLYFDPRDPLSRQSPRAIRPGEGLVAWENVWLSDLIGDEYRLTGIILRAEDSARAGSFVEPVLRRNRQRRPGLPAPLPILDPGCVRRILPHLEEMSWEERGGRLGWRAAIRARFELIRTELNRWAALGDESQDPRRAGPANLRRAIAYLEENISDRISLRDAARAAGLSPKRLIAVFRERGLPSPMAFLRELRMKTARGLLSSGGCSIKEVAAKVGMSSPTTFWRAYRRLYGRAPREDNGSPFPDAGRQ